MSYLKGLSAALFAAVLALPAPASAACTSEATLFSVSYLGACSYNQTNGFTLATASYVTRIRIWYDTAKVPGTLNATLSGPGGLNLTQSTTRGGCQWTWCEGIFTVNATLQAGTYSVTASSPYVCANPSGDSTLVVYGCADSAAGSGFDASAVASGGDANLTLNATLTVAAQHAGQSGEVYLAANYGNLWAFNNSRGWTTQWEPYVRGTLPGVMNIPVLSGMNLSAFGGLDVYLGYGTSLSEMIGATRYKKLYTVSGTATPSNVSQTVGGTATNQTVALGDKLAVTLAGGSLDAATTLSLTANATLPKAANAAYQLGGAYKIDLASGKTLTQDATLEFAYVPDTTASLPADKGYVVAYWDDTLAKWVQVPFTVDQARQRLVVKTKHFSTWAFWKLFGYTYTTRYLESGGYFDLYYNPSHTPPLTPVSGSGMAGFAKDMANYVEDAYKKYRAVNLPLPTTFNVILDPDADASNMSSFSGNVIIKTDSGLNSAVVAHHEVAHELFHKSQNQVYDVFSMAARLWWMESTPDVAAVQLVMSDTPSFTLASVQELRITQPGYFLTPVTSKTLLDAYQYATFLDYLTRDLSIPFIDLWNGVNALAGYTVSDPSLAITQLKALESYVNGRSSTRKLIDVFRNFVVFQITNAAGGIARPTMRDFLTNRTVTLSAGASEVHSRAQMSGYYSAEFGRVVVEPASGATSRAITVKPGSALAAGQSVDVYLMAAGNPVGATYQGRFTSTSSTALNLTVNAGDELLLIAVNSAATTPSFDIAIGAASSSSGGLSLSSMYLKFTLTQNFTTSCYDYSSGSGTPSYLFYTDTTTTSSNQGVISNSGGGAFTLSCAKCNPVISCSGTVSSAGAAMNCTTGAYTFAATVPVNAGQKTFNITSGKYTVTSNRSSSTGATSPCEVTLQGSVTASASAL